MASPTTRITGLVTVLPTTFIAFSFAAYRSYHGHLLIAPPQPQLYMYMYMTRQKANIHPTGAV